MVVCDTRQIRRRCEGKGALVMIQTLAFGGYRSLRDVRIALGKLTVITGLNGTGKSNVYRALRLLANAAEGSLGNSLAREGGMPSALWAGSGRPGTPGGGTRLSVGFADDVIAYELRLGLPITSGSETLFSYDPEVKEETIRTLNRSRVRLLERRSHSAMVRDQDGSARVFGARIDTSESILSQLAEPHRYPVLSSLRERLRRWRFYHQIRTDLDSPVRASQIGTRTPVLAHDARDLASAIQTIIENGNDQLLAAAVADAFDGGRVHVAVDAARFRLALEAPGLFRALDASELSDGTLRYLAVLAALHSPRLPELLVLNEPETSLHPRMLGPLARQIIAASDQSQVIVVTHATALADAIAGAKGAVRVDLANENGETVVINRGLVHEPPWQWTS